MKNLKTSKMPTTEELQKRLERLVKLGMRLRICTKEYQLYKGPYCYNNMINAGKEFDAALESELGATIKEVQELGGDLPF